MRKRRSRKSVQPMSDLAIIEMDNPLFGPTSPIEHRRISGIQNLRDDVLGQMYERHQLGDKTSSEAQARLRAGRLVQRCWEDAGIGRIAAQDTTREPVDGGGWYRTGLTDKAMKAGNRIEGWRTLLGARGWSLVETVLIDKRTIREAAQSIYYGANRATLAFAGRRLRECLDELARDMRLAS